MILDFAGVTFVDSTGMYRLLEIYRAWREQGREVSITNLSGEIVEVFYLVGLTEVIGAGENRSQF
ncbi:MAG: STAS domain-containing protein [Clostridia bacterium]|nr:MAG: STAS domain-containing protein [Clostridia bacterium]